MTANTANRLTRWFYGSVGILALLMLWELGHRAYGSLVLPGLDETAQALLRMVHTGVIGPALTTTALNAAIGWGIAASMGCALGVAAGFYVPLRLALQPISLILMGIPAIAWVVLALLWFGGGWSVPFTVTVATTPLIYVAATQGAVTLDQGLVAMARSFRAPPMAMAMDVYAPHILSHIFPALTTTLAMSWKVSVMAELLSGSGGIGEGIAAARARVDTAETMAWIVILVVVLITLDHLLLFPLKRRMEHWRSDPQARLS